MDKWLRVVLDRAVVMFWLFGWIMGFVGFGLGLLL